MVVDGIKEERVSRMKEEEDEDGGGGGERKGRSEKL